MSTSRITETNGGSNQKQDMIVHRLTTSRRQRQDFHSLSFKSQVILQPQTLNIKDNQYCNHYLTRLFSPQPSSYEVLDYGLTTNTS